MSPSPACELTAGWRARSGARQVRTAEPGVYEVSVGLWPPTAGLRAELRVDGIAALLLGGDYTPPPAPPPPRSPACGLCCVTLLSLHAGAALTLAAEHAAEGTRAYLGLRKL